MRGSVFSYRTSKGLKRWGFVHPVARGSAKQKRRGGFVRKVDAEDALDVSLRASKLGVGQRFATVTLADYLEGFFAERAAAGAAEATKVADAWALSYVKRSDVATVRIEHLTAAHGKRLVGELVAAGLAAGSIELFLVKVRGALNHLTDAGELAGRPFARVKAPKGKGRDMVVLSLEELATVRQIAAGSTWGDMIAVSVATGVRRAELLSLRFEDVAGDSVHVRASSTKTRRPRRVVLFPEAAEVIARRRSVLEAVRRRWPAFNHGGFIFPNERTGEPLRALSFSSHFRAWARKNLDEHVRRFRWHDLRHTCASILLQYARWPLPAVAAHLGHASPEITLEVYAHLMPGSDYLTAEAAPFFSGSASTLTSAPARVVNMPGNRKGKR